MPETLLYLGPLLVTVVGVMGVLGAIQGQQANHIRWIFNTAAEPLMGLLELTVLTEEQVPQHQTALIILGLHLQQVTVEVQEVQQALA
jgi:hypothetical protein